MQSRQNKSPWVRARCCGCGKSLRVQQTGQGSLLRRNVRHRHAKFSRWSAVGGVPHPHKTHPFSWWLVPECRFVLATGRDRASARPYSMLRHPHLAARVRRSCRHGQRWLSLLFDRPSCFGTGRAHDAQSLCAMLVSEAACLLLRLFHFLFSILDLF